MRSVFVSVYDNNYTFHKDMEMLGNMVLRKTWDHVGMEPLAFQDR